MKSAGKKVNKSQLRTVILGLLITFIFFGCLLALYEWMVWSDDHATRLSEEKEFNASKMPSNLKLVSSSFVYGGYTEDMSLQRDYVTTGTRASIISELEPVFDAQGYDLSEQVNAIGTNQDYFTGYAEIDSYTDSVAIILIPHGSGDYGTYTVEIVLN